MTDLAHFAVLAPIPLEHLQSALAVCAAQGSVAFGTMKWELFRRVDAMREDARVAVLIYPSYEGNVAKPSFIVSWFGWYEGSRDSVNGAHPQGMKFRPPSTAQYAPDNTGHWAAFWHVCRHVARNWSRCPKSSAMRIDATVKHGAGPRGRVALNGKTRRR